MLCYGDISDNEVFKDDFKKTLGAIKAKAYLMPGQTERRWRAPRWISSALWQDATRSSLARFG